MNKIVVMLIFIDNFHEAMENIEEIRRPVMVALIDRRISVMARDLGAVHRKFEKDRYLIVMDVPQLERLKERNFDILTSVRDIEMGNTLPVTLSVGVGVGGENFAQTMEYAQAAMDLALGRGGDQALVKDGDDYLFYGSDGSGSAETPSNERVRARIKLYALNELMEVARNIIVMGHRHMDTDALGAAVGVRKLAVQKGKECRILMGETLYGIRAIYDALLKEEEYAGVFVNEDEALEDLGQDTLVVIVDTNRPGLVESTVLLEKAKKLVVLDHHRLSQDFIATAVLTYQEPFVSSTCELLCEMMQHVKEPMPFRPVEADLMLAGITVDTKNFTQKTGAKTFDAAAYLRRNGADGVRVKTYLQEPLGDVLAMAGAVAGARMIMDRFVISLCGSCCAADNPVQSSARAADELMNVAGAQASFVLTLLAGNKTFISARSLGKVNVQIIMERLGGGGHMTMAAATLDAGVDVAEEMLLGILKEMEG